jgi:hypothetical protein
VTRTECSREAEVLSAVTKSCGGLTGNDELQEHVRACEACAAIVGLATLLRQDRDELLRDVRVPAAGQVWWRAALRAHAEAAHAARRPILWLQGIAAACLLGVAAAFGGTVWTAVRNGLSSLLARGPHVEMSRLEVSRIADALQPVLPVAIVIGVCLLVMPIAVYLALSDD